jgi:hypothetical protein
VAGVVVGIVLVDLLSFGKPNFSAAVESGAPDSAGMPSALRLDHPGKGGSEDQGVD